MLKLSDTQIRWFRLRRSGLVHPFDSPEVTARALAGVQAQILPAAALAIWNRTSGLNYAEFNRRLYDQRSVVKLWGQRGTLHVYASEDWPLICGALSAQRAWWEGAGVEAEGSLAGYHAIVSRVEKLLRQRQTLCRSELRSAGLGLNEAYFSSWGGIFAALVQRGYACHIDQEGNEGRFAHREFWLPHLEWNPPAYDEANIELTRRYLRAFGPITLQSLMYWRGAKSADVRRWLDALKDQTVEVNMGGKTLLALCGDLAAMQEKPPARTQWPIKLLYRFDPLLLGVKDKSWIVDPSHYKRIFRPAGHVEGILLAHGRAAGTWRYDRKNGGLAITLVAFSPLSRRVQAAVEDKAHSVAEFFGLPLADLIVKCDTS